MNKHQITWDDFQKVDIRIGTILSAEIFKEARNPSYKLTIDFGDLGVKRSSAQITALYSPEELIGKQICAVVNFPPMQIANIMSECLVLGGLGNEKDVVLLSIDKKMKNGSKIG